MLFLQGSRDALATPALIKKVYKSLRKATLVELEGADHSFKAGKKDILSLLVNGETKKKKEMGGRKYLYKIGMVLTGSSLLYIAQQVLKNIFSLNL